MAAHRSHVATVLCLLGVLAPTAEASEFEYIGSAASALEKRAFVVDARALDACARQSIGGARCLPATDFLGPHRRLAAYRDVLWLFGTAGLRGDETVLVAGQDRVERDFVAGLLHIAGQKRVLVLTEPVTRLLAGGAPSGPGSARGFTRRTVYEAPMRDALIVLGSELRTMRPMPLLLDGRAEAEYWGETVRGARGGHLPGALSLPAMQLRAGLDRPGALLPTGSPVAYGHDAVEGIAYFTLLRAGHRAEARLYVEGWAEWSADGSLPADSVTYPERTAPAEPPTRTTERAGAGPSWGMVVGSLALAAAGFLAGQFLQRRRAA